MRVCARMCGILLCCLPALPLSMCIFNAGSHRCAEGIRTELTHTTYRVTHSPPEPWKRGRARTKSRWPSVLSLSPRRVTHTHSCACYCVENATS